MKYLLFVLFFIFNIPLISHAQIWDSVFTSVHTEYVSDLVEVSANKCIVVGYNVSANNQFGGRLILVDSNGYVEKDTCYYENNTSILFDNVLILNNRIIIIGTKTKLSNINICTDSVIIKIFDFNFNELDEFTYFFSDTLMQSYIVSSVDHNNNILIAGYGDNPNLVRRPFLWKLDTSFNLVAKNDTMYYSWLSTFESAIEVERDSSYYVFAMGMSQDYANMIIRFDYNLNYISMDSTKHDLSLPYHPIMYRRNEIMHVGKNYAHYSNVFDYGIIVLDSVFNTKWFKQYRTTDTNQVPAVLKSISKNDNNVYIGAIYNSDYYYSNDTTWYQLTKMDTNYNIIWEKRFLGYSNDMLTNVLATSDGGCLLAGWINFGAQVYNIHLVKIDKYGTATWVKDIKRPRVEINLFPNPTSQYINLQMQVKGQKIRIYNIFDMEGRRLLSKQINSIKTRIDLSSLSNGVYIIEGYSTKGGYFWRKFLKN